MVNIGGTGGKNMPAKSGDIRDTGSIPGSGRSSGEGNGSPLQYSCLENSMDRRAWWCTVHGVAKNQTRHRDFKYFLKIKVVINIFENIELSLIFLSTVHLFTLLSPWESDLST